VADRVEELEADKSLWSGAQKNAEIAGRWRGNKAESLEEASDAVADYEVFRGASGKFSKLWRWGGGRPYLRQAGKPSRRRAVKQYVEMCKNQASSLGTEGG